VTTFPATALTWLRRRRGADRENGADSNGDAETAGAESSKILPFGLVAVAAALVTLAPGVQPELGWNLFTAALATVFAAATMGLAHLGLKG
jgi:hypothetical protein